MFDNFLAQADKNINYYQPVLGEKNPYNPLGLEATFSLNIVDDTRFQKAKTEAAKNG